jgi:hypothetical protein
MSTSARDWPTGHDLQPSCPNGKAPVKLGVPEHVDLLSNRLHVRARDRDSLLRGRAVPLASTSCSRKGPTQEPSQVDPSI